MSYDVEKEDFFMIISKTANTPAENFKLFSNTRVMIVSALFVAMSFTLGKFLQIPIGDSIRISLENLTILMAGIFFGPFVGGAVAVTADLVGCLLKGYAINPIITIGAAAIGILSGVISTRLRNKNMTLNIAVSIAVSHIVGSMIIKSVGLYIYFGTPIQVLAWRVPTYIITGVVEFCIITLLLKNKAFSAQLNKICTKR